MNYTNTNNKMTTVSKSDIKSIEKKCKMMIGDRYGENNEGGYGVSVKKTSFRNRKGKSGAKFIDFMFIETLTKSPIESHIQMLLYKVEMPEIIL